MRQPPEDKPQLILKGREARSVKEGGKRKYGPFRIRMELQMSPLSVVSDTLEFYVYQETGERAIMAAGMLVKQWYVLAKDVPNRFPKPVGEGRAEPISDEEFRMTWTQAEHERRELLKAGDQIDPVAFHIKPRNTQIITTSCLKN